MRLALREQVTRVAGWLLVALGLVVNVSAVEGQSAVPRPAHVVIVIEENHSFSGIIGNPDAPYINSLAQQGASFTQSFGVTHPSQPNYLALFSGSTQGVTDDACTHTFGTPNLGHDLIAAGFSFAGYSEDLPSVGFTGCTSGQYVRKHNPWVNWQTDISPSVNALPVAVNQPFTSFPSDFTTLPTLSIVVPNLIHDMHSGTVAQADAWLQQFIDPYVQWAKTNNSLLILTWDEDDSTQANQIPTIFVGPMVSPGLYDEPITHYNVLRTLEDMYGLTPIGNAATADPVVDVWIFDYSLSNSGDIAITVGSSGSNTITATLTSGSTQTVSFSAVGLPTGATASFDPEACDPHCTSQLTISTTGSTPTGTFPITVTGSPLSKTTPFHLVVNQACPATAALEGAPDRQTTLKLLYDFRDTVLAATPIGRHYIRVFYRNAPEAVRLMLRHPELRSSGRLLVERFLPAFKSMLAGRPTSLTRSDLAAVNSLLTAFAARASAGLQGDLRALRDDLRQVQVLRQLRIEVQD